MEKALRILDSASQTLESEIRGWTKIGHSDIVERCKEELQQVKEAIEVLNNCKRPPMRWNDVKERYMEFYKMDKFTEDMAVDVDFGFWLVKNKEL